MAESSPKRDNTVGKEEIARYEQFLLFCSVFKNLYCRHVKTRDCWAEGSKRLKTAVTQKL